MSVKYSVLHTVYEVKGQALVTVAKANHLSQIELLSAYGLCFVCLFVLYFRL